MYKSVHWTFFMTQNLPAPNDLILVAIMPFPRDMEIARMLGWYRIPLTTAPKVIAVDYLAFYQPASFGDKHKWMIEFIAPVKGHELLTRAEILTDEQDHHRAQEEYFKIQIGAIEKLPNSIPTGKWKRIHFIYTTGERLSSAKNIRDLGVHDGERALLWRKLREQAVEKNQYGSGKLTDFPIDDDILKMLGFGLMPENTKES